MDVERPSASHLVDRVRRGLAEHPDAGILDAQVSVLHGEVMVDGEVESEERHRAVSRVLAELVPDVAVHNRLAVAVSHPVHDHEPEVLG